MHQITSPNNPLIREIKSLNRRKNRWKEKAFIVEGIKMINEALENNVSLTKIIYTEALLNTEQGKELSEILKELKQTVFMQNTLFDKISNVENTQGVLGLVNFEPYGIEEILEDGLLIYLDGLQDPGNMGTIVRSADAFGITGIIIGENTVDPYNPKVVRASMGSIFRVPLYFVESVKRDLDKSLHGRRIIATSLQDAISLNELEFRSNDVIVIGNEGNGVSAEIIAKSDLRVIIPMRGDAESLNAGVAASVIMYESSRQMMK
ncbi:MAG: TrmH family RNA methyltransferase [Bacillota bacterium]